MSGRLVAPPRVAVLLPLAVDWQPVVPVDLAEDRQRVLDRVVRALHGADLDVVDAAVVASAGDAGAAATRACGGDPEVVLVVAAMAVLPAVPVGAIERLADLPVVIWAVERADPLDHHTGHARIVLDGGTVGAPMLGSVLVRQGRPFRIVLGPVDDPDTVAGVRDAIRAAAAARRIATARVGRIGPAAADYLGSLDLDPDRLRADVGVTLVPIETADLVRAYADAPDDEVDAIADETRARFEVDVHVDAADLQRAARAAAALRAVTDAHRLDGGALTCHVEGLRFEPGLGFAPCFALGHLTSHGVPWACSADLPAAIAMLALKSLGAAAQYHELELVDPIGEELVVASSGEHDLAFAGERPRLVRNAWFPADAHPSVCACFGAPPGDATLLGFVQVDAPEPAFRFVVARGAISRRRRAGTGTPYASFRFAATKPRAAWQAWCRAGVSLHAACSPGDHTAAIATVAEYLRVDLVEV